MKEKWAILPGTRGIYMISNFGRVGKTTEFENGVLRKEAYRIKKNGFQCQIDGAKIKVNIHSTVEKLFGLPCHKDGIDCHEIECWKCGHNPEIGRLRAERLRKEYREGVKTLHLKDGL